MTTVQLAHSLARHTKFTDLATMPADVRLDILLAINGALQELYSRIPPAHKTTTLSHTLRAPVEVAVEFIERYTNLLLEPAFTDAQRGCTALVIDDASPNEIVAANALLDEYLGTALTGNATVYSDVIPVYDVIERITTPIYLFKDGRKVRELDRWQFDFDRLSAGPGCPERYTIIPVGSSQGANPEFLIRVWPLPDADYKVRFDAELSTVRVTFPQIVGSPVDLPVNDRLVESILLPLARAELTLSPSWADPSTKSAMLDRAGRAQISLGLVPWDVAPAFNQVGTPGGF